MSIVEFLKVIILGIVEGITEWLPISSTGHLILADEFIQLDVTPEFMEMFRVVIQLGAILAVVCLYFSRLWPFRNQKEASNAWERYVDMDKMVLWFKIIVACLPAVAIGLPFDDLLEEKLYNYVVVALMLILYGILFLIIENYNAKRTPKVTDLKDLTFRTAFLIGVFQVLSLIPGTSRSGSTIIGGILLGTSRTVAAEFTFFLAIPVMFGASLLKLIKFGLHFTGAEALILLVGMLTAFLVSILAIKFLMGYIKKHDFKVFGWYRIVLGVLVFGYFIGKNLLA
ncbi:MAG: undecaprenyl-diphosphate phosphatase [Lachnospiraceae bacterium]|jgi:undecaprenyl-diphosphatase|nr:undecaprenyl-diphosphate phosphatase [Lachnospiraceae bacterium]MCI9388987.1 undecaprenyl-diphosphate phosphatase [Lachnospiraceae bacterium]MCI9471180.1 undecaprenyl-diphosphate phosphatase [Lachnospiraceae bacterium]